ncbi:ectonucleoside triphosphate diphosphohydrolase 8-like [Orbicella faveolata]|uniref:ectonucleoside triphosphate diphosphohydrolase 8-like n=1 Tax=Orbicella faveolata TaxID=48498 RepID=UPI0009E30E19|nr:ectonucleoside triphosphate diphosphohydrolase 8-like [Orbicella faveolata]
MFVYKWTVSDVVKGTALVKQIGDCTVKDKDGMVKGISSYVADPEQAGQSLQSCIKSKAKKLIPSYLQDKSPIYLGATAGMRLLKETNATAADRILASVRQTLASSPFMFKDEFARIISGEEEGLSSWVTVNYLNGALKDLQETSQVDGVLVSQKLVGALDMGGASTQITFVPSKPPPHSSKLKLYGNEYQLYTHSYLCYGKKEAERRYLAQLVKDSNFSATVDNPCGPKGHQRNVTSSYLWAPPCVTGQHSRSTSFTLKGTGNYTLCAKQVDKLFNFSSCRGNSNCSFDDVYQPPIQDGITFFAFSGYYVVIRDLNLTSDVSLDELEYATKNICRKSWDEIKVIPSNPLYLAFYCFDAQYILTILARGYHFEKSKPILRFVGSVNQRSLGWTLGFMINATNLLPVENPGTISIHLIQSGVYLVVVIVGALLISTGILICALSAGRMYKQKRLRTQGLVL